MRVLPGLKPRSQRVWRRGHRMRWTVAAQRAGFALFCLGIIGVTTAGSDLGAAPIRGASGPSAKQAHGFAPMPSTTATASPTLTPSSTATVTPTLMPSATPSSTATTAPTTTPTATSTSVRPTATAAFLGVPGRLMIPKIGLDTVVYPVGRDKNGYLTVLKHDVGWFEESGKPAGGTSIIFWAHVLRWKSDPEIPAAFADVYLLEPGDHIFVVTATGERFQYVVTQQIRVMPDQVEYLAPTDHERVTLISCIGDNVIVNGELNKTQRLITIAEPVEAVSP